MVAFISNEAAELFAFMPFDSQFSAERMAIYLASVACYVGLLYLIYKWTPSSSPLFRAVMLFGGLIGIIGVYRARTEEELFNQLWFLPAIPALCCSMYWFAQRELSSTGPMIDHLEELRYKLKAA